MSDTICKKNHAKTNTTIANLPKSQKMSHRHVCAACAYAAGYAQGLRDAQTRLTKVITETIDPDMDA